VVGNFDLKDFMKNAKGMMEKAQKELNKITVKGESGAGMVKVTVNAQHEVIELKLEEELLKESKDVVEDLIRAALNDANHKISKATQDSAMSLGDLFQQSSDKDENEDK
jgi:nucleoid-associated protein EbfC